MDLRAIAAAAALLLAGNSWAEGSLGVKAGTLGFGVEASWRLTPKLGVRGGFNQFDYDFDDDVDGVTYQGDLELGSAALLGDVRPWAGGFRLTAGAIVNDNRIAAVADPAATYEIGDRVYTQEEAGVLSAESDFDSLAPYLGIGYDFGLGRRLSLALDLGVLFQGDPDVAIASTGGTLSDDPTLRADLAAEEQSFRDDLEGFDLYPVLSIGLAWNLGKR